MASAAAAVEPKSDDEAEPGASRCAQQSWPVTYRLLRCQRLTVTLPSYKRKLSAILYADVHGFSRLMAADESRTVNQLTVSRVIIRRAIRAHGGRTIDMTGDSVLSEFPSAVRAVECAIAIQRDLAGKDAGESESQRMNFRIGVNIGDVLVESSGIFGEDVNLAARLQTLARPGGICISGAVYHAIAEKLSLDYEYLGERSFKNFRDVVPTYRILMPHEKPSTEDDERSKSPHFTPSQISIAILPFVNMSTTARLQLFVDGLTEDISMGLSKFREVCVIAKEYSFLLKGAHEQRRQLIHELGAAYLLEGSIRRLGDQARVLVRLTNAETDEIIWGDTFDREIDLLFKSTDDLMQTIAATVIVNIEQTEQRCAAHNMRTNPSAYHYFLQGQQYSQKFTKQGNENARRMYEEAIRLNRRYARAFAALSRTHNFDWRYSWSRSPEESLGTALALAQRAVELDVRDAHGHSELGYVHLFMKEHHLAISQYERALTLNPNDTEVMADMADALTYVGRIEEAIELLKTSLRLNPIHADWRLWSLGDAYYTAGDYRAVIDTMNQMSDPSESHRLLAASYAQLGMTREARVHAAKVLKRQPDFSARQWAGIQPDLNPDNAEHYRQGLAKAGL